MAERIQAQGLSAPAGGVQLAGLGLGGIAASGLVLPDASLVGMTIGRVAGGSVPLATLWADQLSGAGIDATVQRAWAGSIAGEIPVDQALPEVWVMDESRHADALALLQELRNLPWRRWACRGLQRDGRRTLRTVLELRRVAR